MTIAEDRLLAYFDGLLSPEDAAALEAELRTDAEAAALVEALRASDLPYREAAEALIPVPDLSEIEAFLADPPKPARTGTPVIRWIGAIAASVLLFVGGIYSGQNFFQPEKTQWAEWLEEIASYQALYTRETLSLGNPPPEPVQRQMARVSKALGQEIKAPDFAAVKADYKYARMYGIEGQPLAQIAYLPKEGRPFSLCMMKTDVPDHQPRFAEAYGMKLATWRHKGIAWVLVGGVSDAERDRYIEIARKQIGS